jgi:glutathione S-transferase
MTITLYENEFSSCSTKVRIALFEKGARWERRRVDLLHFEQKTADYLRLNPNGVVPTAVVDCEGPALIESHIILQFVDERFPGPALTPRDPAERARMRMWLKGIDDAHAAAGLVVASEIFVPYWQRLPSSRLEELLDTFADGNDGNDARRIRAVVKSGIPAERVNAACGALRAFFGKADRYLAERAWMTGEDFGLADIALTPYVDSQVHAVSRLWYGKMPNLARWLADVRARPSYEGAVRRIPNDAFMEQALRAAPGGGGWRSLG